MTEFFFGQLDYAYFASGLGLAFWALGCFMLLRAHQRLLPWRRLGYFALLQGLNDGIRLLLHAFGVHQATVVLCLALTATSFLLLLEFARAGWQELGHRVPGRWLLLLFLGLGSPGALWGLEGLERSIIYGLALPAGLAAGFAIWQAAARTAWGKRYLQAVSLGLAAYTLTFVLTPLSGCCFPSDLLPREIIAAHIGVPLQIMRSLAVWLGSVPLWLWGRQFIPEGMDRFNLRVRRRLTGGMALTALTLLALGWLLTYYLGFSASQETWASNRQSAQQFHYVLENEMSGIHSMARTVAGWREITGCLETADVKSLEICNTILDLFSSAFRDTVIYLMNLQGVTVASFNRHLPDSFVGKSFAFQPYFQQALAGKTGQYLALGLTSLERGFYASAPVYDAASRIIGVAVVKRTIDK
ncbi:MAG: hypothetical protein FJ135_16875, partial [Deltaproteobacteria bacterium]|nr:hypothetical protein [Deltaproteobacteria bacterium]